MSVRLLVLTLTFLLVAVLPRTLSAATTATIEARPDVILVTIDTLRADALGFMGNARAATPVLDRLAAGGRVFTRAHAHNVVTLPSHANILTGLYPFQHGIRDNSGFRLPPGIPTLASVLRGAGYATGAFVSALPLDSDYGLDRGFDVYDDRYPHGSRVTEFVLPERRGDATVAAALAWWNEVAASRAGSPRFLWLHLYDPHAAYAPPEPFASRFRDAPYAGEVAAVDSFLAPLLPVTVPVAERPRLVVVTADHGEALGEHGELTHGLFAYEATLRVPLVVWGPRLGVIAGRDARAAGHIDIFPTVLAAAAVDAPRPPSADRRRPGRSLLEPILVAARTAPPEPALYFEALSTAINRGWAPLRGVVAGERKVVSLPVVEHYDLAADPGERENLAPRQPAATDALLRALPRDSIWPPAHGSPGAPVEDAERLAGLRSLGYVAGAAPPKSRYGPEDDPKNLVGLDGQIQSLIDAYSRGDLERAVAMAREVVSKRPSMPLGRSLLAQALLEMGRRDEALEAMRAARRDGAVSEGLLRQLGLTLAEVGRAAEGVEVLAAIEASGDRATRNAYATALLEAGRIAEAGARLDALLAADPDDAQALESRALLELRRGAAAPAAEAAERALRSNPGLPRAWNYLGVARFQGGDRAAAVDAWQRAVDLDPRLWDAWWNLGIHAAEIGRREQAMSALRRFIAAAPAADYAGDLERARSLLRTLEKAI